MKIGLSREFSLSLAVTFTVPDQEKLSEAINNYVPGSFHTDFLKQCAITLGPSFTPMIRENVPSVSLLANGLAVNEPVIWEGVILMQEQQVHLKFDVPYAYAFQNVIDLQSDTVYPREYSLPTRDDILKAVTALSLVQLKSPSVLYFFISHKLSLRKLFASVYQSIEIGPIHEGVLYYIAKEPYDHSMTNSEHLNSSDISRRSTQTTTDVTRSCDFTIIADKKEWKIRENDPGEQKKQIFEQALDALKTMKCLPDCLLDFLRLSANQSGFLNEASIAVGIWILKMSNNQIAPIQDGLEREIKFNIKNNGIAVCDECIWTKVVAPTKKSGGDPLDRDIEILEKPLTLIYRYTLSATNDNKTTHQITEISLKNESKLKKLMRH